VDDLGLVEAIDRFGERVVIGIADAADRRLDAGLGQALGIFDRDVLRAAVRMVDEAAAMHRPPRVQRLLERIEHEARMRAARHPPADDAAGIGVDDKGDIDEAGPGGDIGEIGHPQRIRARRLELAIDVVERARRGPVAHRGAHGLTPSDADRPANVRKAWDVAGVRLRRLVPVCRPDTSLPDVQMMTDPFRLLRSPSTSEPAYLAWCARSTRFGSNSAERVGARPGLPLL